MQSWVVYPDSLFAFPESNRYYSQEWRITIPASKTYTYSYHSLLLYSMYVA